MKPETIISRRNALFGGTAAGLVLLSKVAGAHDAPLIRKFGKARWARNIDNAVVYRNNSEFASHPYTRGFWETPGGGLISNFSLATVDYAEAADGKAELLNHTALVTNSPGGRRGATVRSNDKGRTWQMVDADPRRPNNDVMVPRIGVDGRKGPLHELGQVDFTDPNVLVTSFNYLYMQNDPLVKAFYEDLKTVHEAPERLSFYRISKDAGKTWSRSAAMPMDGLSQLAGYDSATVRADGRCLLFMTGTAPGFGGAPGSSGPLVYLSSEDGTDFHFLSAVAPERNGGPPFMYPRGVALKNGRLLCVVRRDRDWAAAQWTEIFSSDDGGGTWQFLSRATDFGAPSAPVLMSDGRLVLVYGRRLEPAGIRAVVSEDGGRSWGPELIIREDAGSWDIGYPRAWEVSPGRVGVLYYYNDKSDPIQVKTDKYPPWGEGAVRYMARSFFSLD
ncbi:sialidase family protein [Tsuneonella sp. HG222]